MTTKQCKCSFGLQILAAKILKYVVIRLQICVVDLFHKCKK